MRRVLLLIAIAAGAWALWSAPGMMVNPRGYAPPVWTNDSVQTVHGALHARSTVLGRSVPLVLTGDLGVNVRLALDANGGALQSVVIPPGATWSFNAAIGDPRAIPVRTVAGVPGGGWCDLASRYVQAVRPLLPPDAVQFVNHVQSTGVGLHNVAPTDAVAIWNIDGQPGSFGGRLDLMMTNPLPAPLTLTVVPGPHPDAIVVEARVDMR